MDNIANFLEKRREHLGISQARLAELAEVSLPTVQRFLSGNAMNISFDTVRRIANVLGTDIRIQEQKSERQLLQEKAMEKAQRLTAIVSGTSALESQGLTTTSSAVVRDTLYNDLLSGAKSKIWSSS